MGVVPTREAFRQPGMREPDCAGSGEGGMDPLTGVATAALVEGVKFL
jgi:hypothetical protein